MLLVEDEEAVRSFASRALSTRGYKVLEAGSGVEALEVMDREEGKIDLVVSDVVMPEMDGPTLLRHLRERNPGNPHRVHVRLRRGSLPQEPRRG